MQREGQTLTHDNKPCGSAPAGWVWSHMLRRAAFRTTLMLHLQPASRPSDTCCFIVVVSGDFFTLTLNASHIMSERHLWRRDVVGAVDRLTGGGGRTGSECGRSVRAV